MMQSPLLTPMNIQIPPTPDRILLVGSDRDGLETLTGKFPAGSVVGVAASHGRALELVENRRPQMVIIDSHPGEFDASRQFALGLKDHSDTAFLLLLPEGPPPPETPPQHLIKPFLDAELALAMRVAAYCRVRDVELQRSQQQLAHLQRQLVETEQKLAALGGLLSLCTYCHHTRNEAGEWEALHHFLSRRIGVAFSHGVCERCRDEQCAESGPP